MNHIYSICWSFALLFFVGCQEKGHPERDGSGLSGKDLRISVKVDEPYLISRATNATDSESYIKNLYLFFYKQGQDTADFFYKETGLNAMRTWDKLFTGQNAPSIDHQATYDVFALASLQPRTPPPTASMTRTQLLRLNEERPDRMTDGSDISFSGKTVYTGGNKVHIDLSRTVIRLELDLDFSESPFPSSTWKADLTIAGEPRFTPFFTDGSSKPEKMSGLSLEKWRSSNTSFRYYCYATTDPPLEKILITGNLLRDGSTSYPVSFSLGTDSGFIFERNNIYKINVKMKPTLIITTTVLPWKDHSQNDTIGINSYIESFTLNEGYAFFDIAFPASQIDTWEISLSGDASSFILKQQPDGQASPDDNYTNIPDNKRVYTGKKLSKTRFRVDMIANIGNRASINATNTTLHIRHNGKAYRKYTIYFTPQDIYHTTIINGVEWMNHNPGAYTPSFLDWKNSTGFMYVQGNSTHLPIDGNPHRPPTDTPTTWNHDPQGPCPQGFKVPTSEIFQSLGIIQSSRAYGTYGNLTLSRIVLEPDKRGERTYTEIQDSKNGNTLFLPSIGYGSQWSPVSDFSEGFYRNANSTCQSFYTSRFINDAIAPTSMASIRCVKNNQ